MSDSVSSGDVPQDAAEDSRILEVADHGVDPRPLESSGRTGVDAMSSSQGVSAAWPVASDPESPAPVTSSPVPSSTLSPSYRASSSSSDGSPARSGSGRGGGRHSRSGNRRDHQEAAARPFGLRDFLLYCGIPVLVVALLRIVVFGVYMIPSGSMMDTIEVGDRIVTSKLVTRTTGLKRGDVIVFHDPANWLSDEGSAIGGKYLIKRLIGMPGDVVSCKGAGYPVTINGVAVDESSYIRPGVDPSSFAFSVTVTSGHVFVMGDNRANSADSRYHQDDGDDGLVPISDVVGVGLVTFWPLNRIGVLESHHEVFRNVPDGSAA